MSDPSTVEFLKEYFNCAICTERLKNPHICPHCSKPCCLDCFKQCLTGNPSCPFCRAHLLIHELVKFRWIDDIVNQLDPLLSTKASDPPKDRKMDRCHAHPDKDLDVFCKTCMKCVCSDCALFGDQKHKDHELQKLEDVYRQKFQLLESYVTGLHKQLIEVSSKSKKTEQQIKFLLSEKHNQEVHIDYAVGAILDKLDRSVTDKIKQIKDYREQLQEKGDRISKSLLEVQRKMNGCPKSELVANSKNIQKSLIPFFKQLESTPILDADLSELTSLHNELVPPFDMMSYDIQNFNAVQRSHNTVFSEKILVGGLTWRLKVYPEGNGNYNGAIKGKYLSVFVELVDGFQKTSKYDYRIELLWQGGKDPSKDIIREHASDFSVGESWGYTKFFKLENLYALEYLNPEGNTLHLRFGTRCGTYYQKCQDLLQHASHMERENLALQDRIGHLEQKLRKEYAKNRQLKPVRPRSQQSKAQENSRTLGSEHLHPSQEDEEKELQSLWQQHQESRSKQRSSSQSRSGYSPDKEVTKRRNSDESKSSSGSFNARLREKSQSVQDVRHFPQDHFQHWRTIEETSQGSNTPLTISQSTQEVGLMERRTRDSWTEEREEQQRQELPPFSEQRRHPAPHSTPDESHQRQHLQNMANIYDYDLSQLSPSTLFAGIEPSSPAPHQKSSDLEFRTLPLPQQRSQQSPTQHLLDNNPESTEASLTDCPHSILSGYSLGDDISSTYSHLTPTCSQDDYTTLRQVQTLPRQRQFQSSTQHPKQRSMLNKSETHIVQGTPGLSVSILSALSLNQQNLAKRDDTRYSSAVHAVSNTERRRRRRGENIQRNRSQERLLSGSKSISSTSLNQFRV